MSVHPTLPSRSVQTAPVLEMVLAAFSFATMAAIAHNLRADVPWPLLAFVRILLTFLIVVGLARYAGSRLVLIGPRIMWVRSVVGTMGLMCTFYAVTHLPITDALTIQHTSPLWVAVILAGLHKRVPNAGVIVAVAFGLAGVVLMERPSFEASTFAMGVALFGAFCTAVAVVSLRNLGLHSPLAVVAHYCGLASIVTLGVCFLPAGQVHVTELAYEPGLLWVLPMGMFGTLGQVYMTRAMGKGDTQLLTLVGLSVIAFAAMYDYVLWGVRLDGVKVAGIVLIVVAVAICSRANAPRMDTDLRR